MLKVPPDWFKKKLEEVAIIQTGIAKGKKGIEDPLELPYIRVANVQDGYLDLSVIKTITIPRSQLDRFLLKKGDILLTEGGDYDKLGRGAIWGGKISPCLHQNHVFAVRVDRGKLNPNFFAYQTSSSYGKRYFLSCAKQTTNLASINSSQLKKYPVLLPPLDEQKRVVEVLDAWDSAIICIEKLIGSKNKLKKGLLSYSMSVSHWEKKKLGSLVELLTDGTHQSPKTRSGAFKYITSKNIRPGRLDLSSVQYISKEEHDQIYSTCPVKKGDLLLTKDGVNAGSATLNTLSEPFSLLSSVALIRGKEKILSNLFLLQFLLSDFGQKLVKSEVSGQAITRLTLKQISSFKIPLPAYEEQLRIAGGLDAIDAEIQLLEKQLACLKTQKKGLMQKLLTGIWRVPAEEVAA